MFRVTPVFNYKGQENYFRRYETYEWGGRGVHILLGGLIVAATVATALGWTNEVVQNTYESTFSQFFGHSQEEGPNPFFLPTLGLTLAACITAWAAYKNLRVGIEGGSWRPKRADEHYNPRDNFDD